MIVVITSKCNVDLIMTLSFFIALHMKAASFEIILFYLEPIISLNFVSEGHLQ